MSTPRRRATQICSAGTPPTWAAFFFSALLLTACVSTRDAFEAHRRQAVKDSRTPEGRAYERDFYPAIGVDLANLLKKCTQELPAAETDSFELAVRIDHWGEPKAILVNPVTDLSQCVATGFWYFTFPHPGARFEKEGVVLLLPIRID